MTISDCIRMPVAEEWKWDFIYDNREKGTMFKTLLLKYSSVLFEQNFTNLTYIIASTPEISL